MSRVDELIARLCPKGIPFEPLSSIGVWYGGGTPSKSRLDFWQGGKIPWVSPKDMGKPIIETTEDYITEAAVQASSTKLVPATSVAIVVRSSILDRILPVALIPIPVALNQDMKAVVPHEGILPGYLAHLLRSRSSEILRVARKTGGSVASIESNKLFSFRLPIPPLEVQQEIMELLDTFTELEAELKVELEAELEARRRQYHYYRDALLAFDERSDASKQASKQASVRWMTLSEVATFRRGTAITRKGSTDGEIPVVANGPVPTYYHGEGNRAGETIVVARSGAYAGFVSFWNEPIFLTDAFSVHPNTDLLRPKFVYYFLRHKQEELHSMKKGSGVPHVRVKEIESFQTPVPPLKEQERIVAILDNFDALVNDLSSGLPAEIKARRQQYEYYRDRLLTFTEKVAA